MQMLGVIKISLHYFVIFFRINIILLISFSLLGSSLNIFNSNRLRKVLRKKAIIRNTKNTIKSSLITLMSLQFGLYVYDPPKPAIGS